MNAMQTTVAVLTTLLLAGSAGAATIGVSGGDSDPQLITDPAGVLLTEPNCAPSNVALPATYRCALYDGTPVPGGIFLLDFRLEDGQNALIPITADITLDPLSQFLFQALSPSPLFADGFTFRLAGTPPLVCITCIFFSSHDAGLADPLLVSVVGVNGIANAGALPVPEPAPLLLTGTAGLWVLWSRRRTAREQALRLIGARR